MGVVTPKNSLVTYKKRCFGKEDELLHLLAKEKQKYLKLVLKVLVWSKFGPNRKLVQK